MAVEEQAQELIKELAGKKIQQVESIFRDKVRNVKRIVFQEAGQFVKDQALQITKEFTKKH